MIRCSCGVDCPVSLRNEIAKYQAILARCHEALGEAAESDDDTLPEGIRLRVEALRITDERRDHLVAEVGRLTADVTRFVKSLTAVTAAHNEVLVKLRAAEADITERDNAQCAEKWQCRTAEAEAIAASASVGLARAREALLEAREDPGLYRLGQDNASAYECGSSAHALGADRDAADIHAKIDAALVPYRSADYGRALLAVVEAAERLNKASWGSEAEAVAAHHLGDALAALRASAESIKTAAPR